MSDGAETAGRFWDDTRGRNPLGSYRALVNTVDDGIYQLDPEGRFVAVNDVIVEKTGYSRDALLGEHVSIIVDEEDVERLEREIHTRLETGVDDDTAFDLAIDTADGDRLFCELRFSLLGSDDGFEGTVGIVREIAERSRSHGDLASVWERHTTVSSVLDEADVGVFVLDEECTVVWMDETIEAFFDVKRAAVIGRDKRTLIEETIRDRLADPEPFEETVLATYDDNTYVEQFECRITPGAGREERWLEHRSKPIESGLYAGGRIELYYDITDRKESERARRESRHRFKSLVNAVEEYAIFMLDPDGHVVSWNEGAKQIKGYDAEDILGEHFSTFYTPGDRADAVPESNLERATANGVAEDEGWRVRADGTRFWANVTITAIREDGALQGYAKVTRDMTDRREQEQRLQRERDLIERILETSPVGVAVVDPDGTTSRANERMAELLSLPSDTAPEYTAGQRDMRDANGEVLPIAERPAGRVFETGEPVFDQEVLVDPPNGKRRWLSINATPFPDEPGEPEQVVATATDITDLKALAERRKRELEEREKDLTAVQLATNLFEPSDQPIEDLLEEFVTNLPEAFRHPERTAVRASIGDHEATTDAYEPLDRAITAHTRTVNDTPITIDAVFLDTLREGEAFLPEEQELIDTLATLVKFHVDRREYIDELQAETGRLEQFAYAASHDLQEPLRMISSYLRLLERRYADVLGEEGTDYLEFAVDGADRMRAMIDGLLAYSRVKTQGEPFAPIDLDDILEDVLMDLEIRIEESNAEITAESLPTVEGDASQLRQVFQNLLDNAIEYSDDVPRVHVSAERTGSEWVISVRDEGIGIEPDNQDRIFEVFERLHSRDDHAGTGIGLALCQRIVERHGGEIRVDSEPDEGSTFSFTLPTTA